jgi:hypothetical protein
MASEGGRMIVYVLPDNEANEGGTVAGVYSTEQIVREEAAKKPARALLLGDRPGRDRKSGGRP